MRDDVVRPGEREIVEADDAASAPPEDEALTAGVSAEAQADIARRAQEPGRPRQSGVRAVLARFPALSSSSVPEEIAGLVATLRRSSPKVDVKEVTRAYELARSAHEGQQRSSGEAYIVHPIGVADVLAELGMDTPTIVAALLHDTVEDTSLTVADVHESFGETAALLVDGVTKLERIKVSSKEEQQAESLRKMLIAMAADLRVLLIKLADRLHNMKTIHHLPREKQQRIAEETLAIYAPLAHRLGMQSFKWQLEDLAFATLHPKMFDEIRHLTTQRAGRRDAFIAEVVHEVEEQMHAVKINAQVTGRPKHYWSIYEKMVVRGKEFDEIHDLVGIRVIVDSVKDCYAALGTLHATWRPIPGRFKDYIAMPKFNLYQSLHTTVVGPQGRNVEVQIRTTAMHRTAEFGIAAHWKYKEAGRGGAGGADEAQWLQHMLDMQADESDSGEFMRNVRLDLYADEVFVFTPRGDVVALPRRSTPVDFAYAIHTEVGHRCVGGRVNGRLVSLDQQLRNGETVEVLTSRSPDAGPNRDWLEFVGSARARSKIRAWFSRERREDAIEKGRDELQRALARLGLAQRMSLGGPELVAVAARSNYADLDALYRAIGDGHLAARTVAQGMLDEREPAEPEDADLEALLVPSSKRRQQSAAVIVGDLDGVETLLAQCCDPAPGDEIIGFVTRGRGVSVHRADCPNADDLRRDPARLIDVAWNDAVASTFHVSVKVEALDRKHLLRDATTVLGDLAVNISSAQVTTRRDRVATMHFTFELADIGHLDHLLAQIKRIEGVYDAYRMTPRVREDASAQS